MTDETFFVFLIALITVLVTYLFFKIKSKRLEKNLKRIEAKLKNITDFATSHKDINQNLFLSGAHEKDDEPLQNVEIHLNTLKQYFEENKMSQLKEFLELETIMSKVSDAIIAIDKNGFPLFFNSKFIHYFGDEKLREKRLSEIFRDPSVLEAFDLAMTKLESEDIIVKLNRKNKVDERFFSLSTAPLMLGGEGEAYGSIGIFRDITKLKQAEQIRIDFVSNVSHELRTPLTSIKGFCEILTLDIKEIKNNKNLVKYIETVTRNVNRLWHLVDDLLSLSYIESGTDELEKTKVNVKTLTENVFMHLDTQRAKKNHIFKMTFDIDFILADAKNLEQVLTNLIENAIRYVQEDGVIEVQWKKTDKDQSELRVKDNGPGISAKHLPRLFERFYRVDKTRSSEFGGTGLGLAIVKHIVQRHGGSIWVDSVQGEGSEFICRFP